MAALLRTKYPFIPPEIQVDSLVIGAGVVGLAVAERLTQAFADRTTFVVERRGAFGEETSSRNSEVIHSGIYYPADSAKTALCIRGRDLLYKRCSAHGIPHRRTGKLILANSQDQVHYLEGLSEKARTIRKLGRGVVPLQWLSGDEVREREPDVSQSVVGALLSPETGIVSSHGLMENLEKGIMDSELGELVYGTRVVRIDRVEGKSGGKRGDGTEDGWVVQTLTDDGKGGEGERSAVMAKMVINAAGLNAHHIANQILPESSRIQQHFAKGSYFSYRGPGISSVRHLLYPCPDPNSLAGLGTHLTMNLDNEIRFGPDVEWLDPPLNEKGEDEPDFWEKMLAVNEERRALAIAEVRKFLPEVVEDGFQPDYVGIRPKLSAKGQGAADFSITEPQPGFVNLVGIESPGLTSSLAIAERVEVMVRKRWGMGRGKGRVISEGGGNLDAWA